MGSLSGKTALVTGGAGNIGRATARALANAGSNVVLADRNQAGAAACAAEIVADGGRAVPLHVDLEDDDSIRSMVSDTVAEFGGLDILHNNAAATVIARSQDLDVEAMDLAVWDLTMRVNLRAPLLACQVSIPHMRSRGGGCIVNTVSGAARGGDLRHTAYFASKAALIQLTKAIATQYGRAGIRCNAVSPGFIASDEPGRQGVALQPEALLEQNLIARLGRAEDIAEAVLFLVSESSGFITGQVLIVDGGASAHAPNFARDIKQQIRAS
jgi:NAD(P)-dependent dehydrogenase (short-subunit alcohol dehydrogenase family)